MLENTATVFLSLLELLPILFYFLLHQLVIYIVTSPLWNLAGRQLFPKPNHLDLNMLIAGARLRREEAGKGAARPAPWILTMNCKNISSELQNN